MWFRVNPQSSVPIYQQVIQGIRQGVAQGVVQAGDRLPSVRDLAVEMTLNPNTIAKAYRELERQRVITVIQGRGTYIADLESVPDRAQRIGLMVEAIQQLLVEAHHMQMTVDELRELFHSVVSEWERAKGRNDQ